VSTGYEVMGAEVAAAVRAAQDELGDCSVAVITPASLVEPIASALTMAGVAFERATERGLDSPVSLVPVNVVKGLELDAVVVVEPGRIVREERQGLRALYVALTRSTQMLTVVHADPLPEPMR
jgi:superfamily I DNA/RNA helicase